MPEKIQYNPGDRINNSRLVFVKELPKAGKDRMAVFNCDCGNSINTRIHYVRFGNVSSCGCLKREMVARKNFKHGNFILIRWDI